MSRAILVLDEMPNECGACPLACGQFCMAKFKSVEVEWRPSWCPLKEMPSKMAVEDIGEYEDPHLLKIGYVGGWNKCIEEIERE